MLNKCTKFQKNRPKHFCTIGGRRKRIIIIIKNLFLLKRNRRSFPFAWMNYVQHVKPLKKPAKLPPQPNFMLKRPQFWNFVMTLTFDLEVKFKVKGHWWLSWRPHVSILLSFEDIKEFKIFWWPWPLTLRSSSRSKVTDNFSEDPMSLSYLVMNILRNDHVLLLTRGDNSYIENIFYATIVDLNCPNIFQ